ncbi:tyrosine-type recombinase/integrase [Acinetobacter nosocomialis]|jgi:integrase|uniref:tyrosine-type recombinase/integrase n=1 Tax=Acinetobacter nosocomialis TaxID=106654 RepID=UPI00095A13F7|nr:tyrosine-type recombinase/integrase [Acinetobacter nosocomialis]MBR7688285.1 tyrosine-type recombinase/integrase [Acinetobacter nosocomialis]MBR7702864.1 tyrosine-type recombinase/integrase [Acinetobacter nosocomialis]MBR7761979.1 tyrosine-type recombinase/integrase [Acinetobacter nosocomialis]OJU91395.1 MAG: integrase [Acinetobacter sp. 38-8]
MKRSANIKKPMKDAVLLSLEAELKEYRINDGDNLHFVVSPKGNKRWDLRYKSPASGKWTWLGLGTYPEVSGKRARLQAQEWLQKIADGIDPMDYKNQQKQIENGEHTFKNLALEYCNGKTWTDGTRVRNEGALTNHVYDVMGKRDYRKITKKEWLELFKQIQQKPHPKTGKPIIEMGNRVRGLCKDIYDLAEVTGRIDYNPIVGIEKFLKNHESQNMPHVTVEELPDLLKAIHAFKSRQTSIGLQLSLMFGCRPNEMRKAVWNEFDLDNKLWNIPAHRMKKRIEHTIPLSNQALDLLQELKSYSGDSPYLFRGRLKANQPISENTFGKALKDMGYKGKQTPHGFRHILSTALREHGFQREWVEAALAHKVRGVEGIYNKAVYLKQRKAMMQTWANYLDGLVNDISNEVPENNQSIDDLATKLNLSDEQKQLLAKLFEETILDNEFGETAA